MDSGWGYTTIPNVYTWQYENVYYPGYGWGPDLLGYFTLDTVFADQDGDGDNELTSASLGEGSLLEVSVIAESASGIESFELTAFELEWLDTGASPGDSQFAMAGVTADGGGFRADYTANYEFGWYFVTSTGEDYGWGTSPGWNYGWHWAWGWDLWYYDLGARTLYEDVNLSDPAYNDVFDDLVALDIVMTENFLMDDITLEYVSGV